MTETKEKLDITHVGSLASLYAIRKEMSRVYRLSRKGEIDVKSLTKYIYSLREIAAICEKVEMGDKLTELERKLHEIVSEKN